MDSKKFLSTFATTGVIALSIIGYVADHSFTLYERRMALLIWVLLVLLCLVISFLVASSFRTRPRTASRPSQMTPQEREDALLFRHYPQTANFRTRVHGNAMHTTFNCKYKR